MENESGYNPEDMPSTQEQKEPMDWDALIARSHSLMDRVTATPPSRCSYSHVTRNLILAAEPSILNTLRGDQMIYDQAKENLDLLEKYFEMIDTNPELAEKEMNERQGMFPDIYESGMVDSNKVVLEIEKRLKG